MSPTEEQQAIIAAVKSGKSLLIIAGAGTGKTSTIELFASYLSGNPMAIAFNVKVKQELEKRLPKHFTVLTANGLGHRAWGKLTGKRLNVESGKMGDIIKPLLEPLRLPRSEWVDYFTNLIRLCAQAKHKGLIPAFANKPYRGLVEDTPESWAQIAGDNFLDFSDQILSLARQALSISIDQAYAGLIDFDDQIYMSTLFGAPYTQTPVVIVDEYQDLSPINHKQIEKLRPQQLIAVGDPRQSIYGFRGADSGAMLSTPDRFTALSFAQLPLSLTFRCPKCVVERQQSFYPEYQAHESNLPGTCERWIEWDAQCIPAGAAILCRNNAPLLDLAFKLLREGVGVNFLGRDIGKSVKALLKRICGTQMDLTRKACEEKVSQWQFIETQKAGDDDAKLDQIYDRAGCAMAILANATNLQQALDYCDKIFGMKEGIVTLSTGHKAKGLEWHTVIHLDPWRLPSKYAKSAAEKGNEGPLQQENNLRYVIETRTKDKLILASLEGYMS